MQHESRIKSGFMESVIPLVRNQMLFLILNIARDPVIAHITEKRLWVSQSKRHVLRRNRSSDLQQMSALTIKQWACN